MLVEKVHGFVTAFVNIIVCLLSFSRLVNSSKRREGKEMFLRVALLCFSIMYASPAFAEDFLQDILDALTEVGDAMVSVSNVKFIANKQDQLSETGRNVFQTSEKELFVTFNLYGVAEGEVVSSSWSRLTSGKYVVFGKASITVPKDFNNKAHFKLELFKNGVSRPAGQYKVDILFKDIVLDTAYMKLVGPLAETKPLTSPVPEQTPASSLPSEIPLAKRLPSIPKTYQDDIWGFRARYPKNWKVQETSADVRRFVVWEGRGAGMVDITVQQLLMKSRGGKYNNLNELVDAIRLLSLNGNQDVNTTQTTSFSYDKKQLNWPGVKFEVQALKIGTTKPYRQIFFILEDNREGHFYNINYTAPLQFFRYYEAEAKKIIDTFELGIVTKDFWGQ